MPLLALAAAALAAKTNAQRDGLAAEALARALARKLRGSPWVLPATLRVRFKTPGGLRLTLSVGGQLAVDAIARMTGKMKAVFAVRGALQAAIGTHRCAFFVFIIGGAVGAAGAAGPRWFGLSDSTGSRGAAGSPGQAAQRNLLVHPPRQLHQGGPQNKRNILPPVVPVVLCKLAG